MKGTLFQIRQVVANLSRKNNRQSTLELSHLINQTGLHGQLFYIKSLITTITSESEIRECFKLQTLREELSKLAKSSDVNFFRTELSQLNLSADVIKALKLSPDAEYILNQNPQQPTLLSQNCLFDYLCEHSDITIDRVTHEEPIFSRCWKEPVSCSISIPPIHGVSKEIIGKLAWNCTGSYNTFNTLLNDVHGSKMSYNDVAELLIIMMTFIERQQNMSERSGGVISPQQNIASKSDAKIIASVLKERCKDWNIIASVMDSKAYECKHHEAALFLVRIFQYVDVFPLDSFFTKIWMNRKAQGCIVHAFVSIASGNKEESGYLLKQLTSAFGKNSVRGIRGLWESTNFVERIIDIGLSASADFDQIYSLTDVVLPMLCKCKPTASRQRAIVATLRQCPQLSNVIHPLWKNYKLLLAQGLRDRYLEDPSKIEDIINAVPGDDAGKVLTTLNPTSFALDVACLLTKKNLLNFEKWICEQKRFRGPSFGRQIVTFIKSKHSMNKTVSPHPLDKNILGLLISRASSMGQQQECHELEQHLLSKTTKSEGLNNRANDMFACYFERKYTVEHFVDEMIKARDSQNPVENDFYVLLVKSLFEEFKRIKDFSKHDAAVLFGELYGEMVNRKVLTYCSLIHMLRIILYAVAKPIQSNYFHCGITALQRFKERLYEWPSYCCQLKEISSIEIKDPSLYAIISSHANSKFTAVMNLIQQVLRTIRFETLLDSRNVSVIKSLSTLFANLPSMKLSTVYAEIENVFNKTKPSPKHRNILIETSLFITALTHENTQKDCIRLKQHMNQSVDQLFLLTINSVNIFLKRREYDKQSAALFETLGELLGLLTLDLNKPLLYHQLSPRLLLTDQLTRENFDVMLEFVIRFLKGCEHSTVFTPNNPWISPLLQIVAKTSISPELASHHESAKQLLQSLNVDAEQYLLEHSPKPSFTEAIQKLQKFSRERNSDESGVFTEFIETHQPIPINKLRQVLLSDKSLAYSKELSDLPTLSLPQCLICPSLGLEHWMVIVKCCLDFALQDICKTASVSMDFIIATVKQLIQKDFATETDVSKISAAADRVFLLAQKLSQYTCRSCLDTKLWKYIAHYVAISNKQQSYIKQQDYFKQPEQMKEMVMSNLHPQMEKAVSIKLAELRNSAQRQLSNFISEITPEREEAIAKGNKKFIAKGFEYLLDGPDLPPSLKIAYGGVTDEQMSLYAGGVSADVINKIDDKFVEMLSEPIHFDIVSKYVRLMPFTMIDSITKKLIASIIQYPSVVRADRAVEILAIIFHSLKNDLKETYEVLSNVLRIYCSIFEKSYKTPSFDSQPFMFFLSSLIESFIEKSFIITDTSIIASSYLATLDRIHPSQYPKFTCQWLQLFTHRCILFATTKTVEKKNIVMMLYYKLLHKYLMFIKPILSINTVWSRQIITATLTSLYALKQCFPEFIEFFALPLVTALPLQATSLRLVILTTTTHNNINVNDQYSKLFEMIPNAHKATIERMNAKEIIMCLNDVPALSIVVSILKQDGLTVLTEMIQISTAQQKYELLNAIVDLMRLPSPLSTTLTKFLSNLLLQRDIVLTELIVRVLVERSFGKLRQEGAYSSLVEIVHMNSNLINIISKKSTVIANKLAEL